MGMRKRHLMLVTVGVLATVVACAIITVNVYFPEKDVKSAYKSLEDELLEPEPKKKDAPPTPKRSSDLTTHPLLALAGELRVVLVPDAFAQDDLSQRISEEIKNYPEVVAAYKGLGQRLGKLDELRNKGLVGEGRDGKVAIRGQVGDADKKLVDEENKDREVIIGGMAKAILKLTKQEGSSANLANVKKQASETFASLRRDRAKSGWPIQLPDGTWKTK
jgi:hypothetical protein